MLGSMRPATTSSGVLLAVGCLAAAAAAAAGPTPRLILREAYLRPALAAQFDRDGSRLLVRADDGGTVWDLGSGAPLDGVAPPARAIPEGNVFDPAGRRLAQIKPDGSIEVRELRRLESRHRLEGHAGGTAAVAFDEDSRLLFSGGADGKVRVWDVETGSLRKVLEHGAPVTGVVVLPGRGRLVSAGANGTLRTWDRRSFEVVANQLDPGGGVRSLSVSPDGRLLATVADDGAVRLWETTAGGLLATLAATRRGDDWLVVSPAGWFDGTGEALTRLAEWETDRSVVRFETLSETYFRPGLLAEILAGGAPAPATRIDRADLRAPAVEFVSTEVLGEPGDWRVRVRLAVESAAEDAGVRDLSLFRDNALVKTWQGALARDGDRTVVETDTVIGEQEARLSAYAFNLDGVRSEIVSTALPADGPAPPPVAHVLSVGINAHRAETLNRPDAVANATEFAEGLRLALEGTRRFAEIRVSTLTNRDATREGIGKALSALAAETRAGDAVFFFFSGNAVADRRDFALLPHDAGSATISAGIDARELTHALQGIPSAWLVVALDTASDDPANVADSPALARLSLEAGLDVLVASSLRGSPGPSLGRLLGGTALSARAADGPPANGMIDLLEWLSWSRRQTAGRASSRLYRTDRPDRTLPLVLSRLQPE